jgi:nucleoside-triphosphatase THEP1
MTQREALDILKTGRNVFITGPAGSGKTYVVNQYIKYLKDHGVPLGITASTGIAATHMGGVTIHSWSGISVKDYLSDDDIAEIGARAYVKKKVEGAKVLIIDEVSMLHHFRFDMIDRVLRHIKKSDQPFGGLQVVLCGDFFQLPPVSRLGEPEARFIYESDSWKKGKFAVCYLSENYRQSDDVCLSILNEIRSGEISDSAREHLMSRHVVIKDGSENSERQIDYGQEEKVKNTSVQVEPTRLFTHNIDVDTINDIELKKVSGYETVYEMVSHGKKPLVESLKKSCLAPELLRLKKGARVMCVKNNYELGYVNGTLGVVVSCGFGVDPMIRTAATPDYPEGRLIAIPRESWAIVEDDGKIIAEISQYPLRLAWAITVHKSQGMSLDAVEVDLSKAFEPGMGYVALSRVRTLAGLKILGINENALKVHPEVLEFDRHLQELSLKACRDLEATNRGELEQVQNEFLAKVAPLHRMENIKGKNKKGNRGKFPGLPKPPKPPKISTYQITAELVRQKKSLAEMAKERGLEQETIVSHLEELVKDKSLNPIEFQYLKKEVPVSHFVKIEQAFEELDQKMGDSSELIPLSPVKTKVKGNVSWKEIRLARVLLGYVK